jgi:competence protein ComEA
MSLRDRLASLSRGELIGLVGVLVVVLGGAGLWYTRSLPRPVNVDAARPAVSESGELPASPSPSAATIVVDVAGWVQKPGVYEFTEGQRVIDALQAAGGPKRGADLTAINLAAPLADGTQIVVSKEASAAPPGSTDSTGSGAPGLVNVNTAAETELETLPGIGPVLGAAIIKYRTDNGPFTSVDDLDNVSGIGPATLEELRPLVTV